MSELSDLVNQRLQTLGWDGYSVRELAARSDINKDVIARIRNGSHSTPNEDTIAKLSTLLGLSVTQIRAAAGLKAGEEYPYEPPEEAARLTLRQRAAVTELIRSMVATKEGSARSEDQARRNELLSWLEHPEMDAELLTRLDELGHDTSLSARRRSTLRKQVRESRRDALLAELEQLPE